MRALRCLTPARLPVFASAALVLGLFLVNMWNFAVERDWPKLRIRSAAPLSGVAKNIRVVWTLEDFLSGETQKAASAIIGRNMPVFPLSVRAKNQFVFSLFGSSAAPGIAFGRNGQLYETVYIDEFCRRGAAPDLKAIARWAASLREMQDVVERAGKRFVFLISPSKAARYPADLPSYAPCAARATAMPDKLAPYVAALEEAGVGYVDGAGLITKKQPDYAMPLFPRGGTHWNTLGAALSLQEITRVAPTAIGDFAFDWRPAPEPLFTDRDLVDLLNLLWVDVSYPTPFVIRAGAPTACTRAPRLVALGSSFLHELLMAAAQAPCPPESDYWFHMRTSVDGVELGHFLRAPGDPMLGERKPATTEALDDNLRNADLIVLEENEFAIGTTRQFQRMLEAARRWR